MGKILPRTANLTRGRGNDIAKADERGKKGGKEVTGPNPTLCTLVSLCPQSIRLGVGSRLRGLTDGRWG